MRRTEAGKTNPTKSFLETVSLAYHLYNNPFRVNKAIMERAIDNALLEKVLTYIPFLVYDGKARYFVLCVHRG